MSNKSNNTGSLISLPKGGGALSGLGEKFSPDLHTGTGNFSIPLALPAGRNGFQPQLTLSYSTGQGQGFFGLGWALSLPGVSRKTSKGLPRYQDAAVFSEEADVFILSGAEDLVPIEVLEPGRTRYRPRTEGLFARIEHHQDSAQATNYWEVRTKDGLTSFYGTNPLDAPRYPAAPANPSEDPAVTSEPNSPERIFSWALTLTLDPFQNRIEYLYDRQRSGPSDEVQGHHWDIPVLKLIRYGDHGDRTSPGFLVTVEFEYEDRPDPFSDCRAGFEIRQTRRCRSVIVKTHAGAERTVKEYRFRYRQDGGTLVSLLEAVEVYGFDSNGEPVLSLPPLELSYTSFEPERRDRRDFFPVRGKELPVVSLAHPTLAMVDLHGQGLPDILELGETVRYWRNLGDGEFDMPRSMREAPAGLSLRDPGVQLMDADGDGRMDLMVTRDSISGYFPLRFGPRWDRRSFHRWSTAPSFDLKDPEVRFLDLTGDGVTDALRTSRRLECYFNHPEKGWHGSRWLERKPLAVFPDVVFSDPRVLTGDMNGDGLTDIVFVHDGSLCYWPSHGYGDFGPRIQMHNGPRLPTDYDPKRLLLGDVNGDGLADLVYVDHQHVYLWLNQSGNAWSAPIVIKGTPGVMNEDAIRLVDLLGSGVPGILWSSNKVEHGRPHYFFLDLTGGAKPYLLHGMRNNLGAETRVEYRPSTQFYLDDRRRGSTPWMTTLPFPVQTVARVEVMDAFSGGHLVTRYTYHHGYWDGHEREFRGFGRVEQADAETFADHGGSGAGVGVPPQHTYSPPLLSKSWFHQGPVENEDGTWKELDYRAEQWSGELKDELVLAELAPNLAPRGFAAEVLSDHPIAFYRLSEPAGATTTSDVSGNGNHGAVSSTGITLGVPGLGVGDTAARFDGLGSGRIVVPSTEQLNPKRITMEALVEWSGPNVFQQRILEKSISRDNPWLAEYGLSLLPDGAVRAELATGSPLVDRYATSKSKVKPNTRTHLAATYDGSTLAIYIDGVLDTSPPVSGDISSKLEGSDLGIGNKVEWGRPFHGVIDEVALYDRALSADRVRAHIAATFGLTRTHGVRIHRDAVRSLRGSLLRTELYAIDGDPRQDRPYTITESLFQFREEAPPAPAQADRRRIFFPHERAQRTTQWERGDDPMTQLSFTHRHDELGQPLARTQIACPRGWRSLDQRPGTGYLATRTLTTYAAPLSPQGPYIHDRVARNDSFEITATLGKTVAEVVAIGDSDPSLRRIGQVLSFFDGPAFTGLPLGTVDRYGAVSRTENLVLTPEVLADAYGTALPPYLNAGTWTWPEEYPQTFRDTLPLLAGYVRHDVSEPGVAEGLFSVSQRLEHDFQQDPGGEGRGLVSRHRDPLGHDTTVTYDFELLPASVMDAAGLVTRAEYDLRFLQPSAVTDPNGNRQVFDFEPNGLLSAVWVRGKTAAEGDQTRASLRYQYDLFAFQERSAPVSVAAVRFIHHDSEAGVPTAERDATIESREYSDGFGRVLQSRAQGEDLRFGDEIFGGGVLPADQSAPASAAVVGRPAAPGIPNVIVSGSQVYDNKGRIVEKYEPFFSEGWDYVPAKAEQRGQSVLLFYDPRGQMIRTLHPDGSEELVVHGVPGTIENPDLSIPTVYEPTPWEAYSYDVNDNAGRTHPQSSVSYRHYWNTPASIEIDALGRTVRAVQRNRSASPAVPLPPIEEYTTRSGYDLQDNLVLVIDALHRVAFTHAYDLAKRPLHTLSLDAGERWTVLNAAGLALESRDSKGALQLQGYDVLRRPLRLWARDAQSDTVTLRTTMMYGDEFAPPTQPSLRNLLGKLYLTQDGVGRLTFSSYDFKGNLLEKTREVIADSAIEAQVNAGTAMARGYRVDWDQSPVLEGSYTTSLMYDALNRITLTTLPEDVKGNRQTLSSTYNRAGALESVNLTGQPYVRHLAYDAKGRRVLAVYGNGYFTRYAYDERTFRLVRLRTETYSILAGSTPSYAPHGGVLQDFAYAYDLAGNILLIHDRSPNSGIRNAPLGKDALDRDFRYDALYRLTEATGRESIYIWPPQNGTPNRATWDRSPRAQGTSFFPPGSTTTPDLAPEQTRAYTETYAYDPVGNLIKLWHGTSSSWTRHFGMGGLNPSAWDQAWTTNAQRAGLWNNPPNNRLTHAGDNAPTTPQSHIFDICGNMVRENGSRHFTWNHADQLIALSVRPNAASPASMEACYLYDGSGQRVKKWVRNQSGEVEVTLYIDSMFECSIASGFSNNILHVTDGQSRIATVRIGDPFPDDGAPNLAVKIHFRDHLGSSHVILGIVSTTQNALLNREEFYPYGETSYGGFTRKRYRFTGKERDEESGLSYHGARYYAPWLGRWANADPAGMADGLDLYTYVSNNPMCFFDPHGLAQEGAPNICYNPPVSTGSDGKPVIDIHPVGSNVIHMARPPETPASSAPVSNEGDIGSAPAETTTPSKDLTDAKERAKIAVAAGGAFDRAVEEGIWAIDKFKRGKILEIPAGNNPLQRGLGAFAKDADRATNTRAIQIKSVAQSARGTAQVTRNATKDALNWIKNNPGPAGRAPQAHILLKTGTSQSVTKAVQGALAQAKTPIPGAVAPKITIGLPGVLGVATKAFTVVGGVLSAKQLYEDYQNGDVAGGVGSAVGAASSALSSASVIAGWAGAASASAGLATGGAYIGAFSIGYGIGTLANKAFVEDLIDKYEPGAGAVGEWYYQTFLR